tara:strand:+ start:67 stop:285 length:219 start_codon:yes stop_codon:yes gene_type:complete
MFKKIKDAICDYRAKKRLKSLLFSYIVGTRNDMIWIVVNTIREGGRLPVKQLKTKGQLLEKYTTNHRSIKGL